MCRGLSAQHGGHWRSGWGGVALRPLRTACLPSRQMKGALTEIIQLATLDSDPWVLMVADILKSFPDTGSLNLDLEEQNPNVQDILGELREKGTCGSAVLEGQTGLPFKCLFRERGLALRAPCVLRRAAAPAMSPVPPSPTMCYCPALCQSKKQSPVLTALVFPEIGYYFHVHESPDQLMRTRPLPVGVEAPEPKHSRAQSRCLEMCVENGTAHLFRTQTHTT